MVVSEPKNRPENPSLNLISTVVVSSTCGAERRAVMQCTSAMRPQTCYITTITPTKQS
jgi:hypothetical protein